MKHVLVSEKSQKIIEEFLTLPSHEKKYERIIQMGRNLPPFPSEEKKEKNLVVGCQSLLYLHTTNKDGLIYFAADSDALISKGLAALLIAVYSEGYVESVMTYPPAFLQEIGLYQALSPARSNGLISLFRKMQQEALEILKKE